ncbi:ABC transporter ATP-binding protein [Caballeronia sp. dw_19]|uniref:ABC transporter ATP-binding protein n=1 Tax=Caballeronia sp. dw_19 TaxID=2719791 RepID=UPI001BD30F93|nr:ABC transporter ATP-binding protein [Caballeronia sp. dw_19]
MSSRTRLDIDTSAQRTLLDVQDLNVRFVSREATVNAVNGVSLSLAAGEVLCIIGESGSGKSVTLRALMRLLPPERARISGTIAIDGEDVLALDEQQLSAMRGAKVSMIFQEPMTALDPVFTIGDQIAETIRRHHRVSRTEADARALDLLERVRVPSPERRRRNYPHELSGGLRQRAMIAVALSCRPRLLLADEPTTALDATVQIQVLILLKKLQQEFGMGIVIVTHDLGVAAQIADKVAVMYAGRIVEYGSAREVLLDPKHPYTLGMLSSTVKGQERNHDIEAIPGSPPDMRRLPPGCSFAPRCKYAKPACLDAAPDAFPAHDDGYACCIRLAEIA